MPETQTRILAVTDLSPAGDVAIAEAYRMAQRSGGVLGVVHATPALAAIRPLFPQRLAEEAVLTSQFADQAARLLRARLHSLGAADDIELFIEQGHTADVALAVAERWHPTLVVVGSPQDSAVGAVGLVRHGTTPVLVARPSSGSRRVIVGTDFSDPSLPAIRAAAEAASAREGELVVTHAIEIHPFTIYGVILPMLDPTLPAVLNDTAQRRLDEAIASLGIAATTEVVVGAPGMSLAEAARRLKAELLVVATHGRSGVTRFVLGSVTEAVIQHAPCSVLVVRLS
jgi:nucleotide-binding universal stress UspA family protein